MSSAVTPPPGVKRRSIATPTVTSPAPAAAVADAPVEAPQLEAIEELQEDDTGLITPSGDYATTALPEDGGFNTNSVQELMALRADVEEHAGMLLDKFRDARLAPMSRDTVYAFGEAQGHFKVLSILLTNDIANVTD